MNASILLAVIVATVFTLFVVLFRIAKLLCTNVLVTYSKLFCGHSTPKASNSINTASIPVAPEDLEPPTVNPATGLPMIGNFDSMGNPYGMGSVMGPYNPATGLPMMVGELDVAGNPFGTDLTAVNPANGLPMIGGEDGLDIEGNPYGTDWSEDSISTSFDDSLGNSFDNGSGHNNW